MVRDKIPEILEREGYKIKVRIIDESILGGHLTRKLQEEAGELLGCVNERFVEELADVVEVVSALTACCERSFPGALEKEIERKLREKGGFEKRQYLLKCE
jgi:predicted house-cleaning noncanonical NTP pyrophosphatase (MazG superfamily)